MEGGRIGVSFACCFFCGVETCLWRVLIFVEFDFDFD